MSGPRVVHPRDAATVIRSAGDEYRYLATGAQTGGTYFMLEAVVPPGAGPRAKPASGQGIVDLRDAQRQVLHTGFVRNFDPANFPAQGLQRSPFLLRQMRHGPEDTEQTP